MYAHPPLSERNLCYADRTSAIRTEPPAIRRNLRYPIEISAMLRYPTSGRPKSDTSPRTEAQKEERQRDHENRKLTNKPEEKQ